MPLGGSDARSLAWVAENLGKVDDCLGYTATKSNLFDDDTGTRIAEGNVGDYCELELPVKCYIYGYRQFGHTNNTGDGVSKIEFFDGSAWSDWKTGIGVRTSADWSDWVVVGKQSVEGKKIRFTATTIDSYGSNYTAELEVLGVLYID